MALQKIPGRAIKLGTDNAPDTAGDVVYFDGSAWTRLAIGDAGQQLSMNAAGTFPQWGYFFGGSQYGYCHGGTAGGYHTYVDIIDKFPFATDSDATDVGNLTRVRSYLAGFHSTTHGYAISGQGGPLNTPEYSGTKTIDKYAYASDADATFVGDLVSPVGNNTRMCSGFVNAENSVGYAAGFDQISASDSIQKISTVSDGDAVASAGTLHTGTHSYASACSASHGYCAGGWAGAAPGVTGGPTNQIQKFAFSSDTNGTDVANLTEAMYHNDAGASSSTHGYVMGFGHSSVPRSDKIEKYSFATDADATDVGNLTVVKGWGAGQSSKTDGYLSGGEYLAMSNNIERFSFSSDGDATDIGDLTVGRFGPAGTEY